jgi:hypothetical protein
MSCVPPCRNREDDAQNEGRRAATVVSVTSDLPQTVRACLIRDVPDDVVASIDANAKSAEQTRAKYLRRLLADQRGPALTGEQLIAATSAPSTWPIQR